MMLVTQYNSAKVHNFTAVQIQQCSRYNTVAGQIEAN